MTTTPATRPPRAPAALPMTPGRWITLIIGVPIALALIAFTAFSLVSGIGRASYPVNATIPLQSGQLVASTNGADITLHQDQARSSTARLTGTVQYSLVRPKFTVIGTDISLDCHIPTGNCGLDATLGVPLGRGDLVPGLGEQPGQALAQQDGILRDHYPHGSSAAMIVGPPAGDSTDSRPSTPDTLSARPDSPGLLMSAPPIPSSLIMTVSVPG